MLVLLFVTFLFQGPKLEPLKEDTLAGTYKSVSQHWYKNVTWNTDDWSGAWIEVELYGKAFHCNVEMWHFCAWGDCAAQLSYSRTRSLAESSLIALIAPQYANQVEYKLRTDSLLWIIADFKQWVHILFQLNSALFHLTLILHISTWNTSSRHSCLNTTLTLHMTLYRIIFTVATICISNCTFNFFSSSNTPGVLFLLFLIVTPPVVAACSKKLTSYYWNSFSAALSNHPLHKMHFNLSSLFTVLILNVKQLICFLPKWNERNDLWQQF